MTALKLFVQKTSILAIGIAMLIGCESKQNKIAETPIFQIDEAAFQNVKPWTDKAFNNNEEDFCFRQCRRTSIDR